MFQFIHNLCTHFRTQAFHDFASLLEQLDSIGAKRFSFDEKFSFTSNLKWIKFTISIGRWKKRQEIKFRNFIFYVTAILCNLYFYSTRMGHMMQLIVDICLLKWWNIMSFLYLMLFIYKLYFYNYSKRQIVMLFIAL